jgi:polysaccharide biosynthesis transport protein
MALALGLFAGLTLGAGASLGLHFRKAPLMSVAQAEYVLDLPSLGAIPKAWSAGTNGQAPLVKPLSPAAEAFRTLRAAITLKAREGQARSVLFTSATPGEGKTFCAVNFASSLAGEGLRTLLIDGDLRRPRIGGYFLGGEKRPGVGEVLAGRIDLSKAVSSTQVDHLDVLPAGSFGPGAPELLVGDGIGKLIDAALATYDRVVVDTAPVLPVSDALLIAAHVHSICLVVRARKTASRFVSRAERLLTDAAGKPPTGFVLNRIKHGFGGYDSYA